MRNCIRLASHKFTYTPVFAEQVKLLLAESGYPRKLREVCRKGGVPQVQVKDPVDLKLREALRERDAIIRNLLERVNELEWRVTGGFTSAAKIDERPVITGSANSRVINSLTSTNTVVSTSTYDATERQVTEAI